MKLLSETLTELGIAFTFPIEIKDANGNEKLHAISARLRKAGYDTDIGYSDGVVCISK